MLNLLCMGLLLTGAALLKNHADNLDHKEYKITPYDGEGKTDESTYKKESKRDFTSKQSWDKELSGWNDYEVMDKINRMGASHYGFTVSEARNYIAKNESINGRNSMYGKCR